MQFKELGKTGVLLPEVGLGTWEYTGGTGPLLAGLEAGALLIDTAESYGTELLVGRLIRELSQEMRGQVFIATKVSPQNFCGVDFRKAVDGSLNKLGVEAIDLIQLHEPNPAIPIDETMDAVARLIDAGKVRFCGVSNFSVPEIQAAQKALGRHRIVSNQVRHNLIDRTIEKDVLPYCQANGITVIAYSPLAKNINRILDCDPYGVLLEIGRAIGKTPAQIMINWLNCKDGVITIPKANSAARILENCASSDWRLSSEQIDRLNDKIQYRHRSKFDSLVRKLIPRSLHRSAARLRGLLPRSLRRRIT
jgi:diketogulonate reductase-like aldo/keto reductase